MSINKVILIGFVGKDPEIRQAGAAKNASFSFATTETYKDKEGNKVSKTEWHQLSCWRTVADLVEKYVKKGSKLWVEGKLTYDEWEKDGVKHRAAKVQVKEIQFLDTKTGADDKPKEEQKSTSAKPPVEFDPNVPADFPDSFENVDDLPF